MSKILLFLYIACLLNLMACSRDSNTDTVNTDSSSDSTDNTVSVIETSELVLNPSGFAPLTASLQLELSQVATVTVTVVGQHGSASDIVLEVSESASEFELDILGLYPDVLNQIDIAILNDSEHVIETQSLTLQTAALDQNLPAINIDVASSSTEILYNFVNYFGFSESFRPQRPFIFDQFGDIRWYLDFSEHPTFSDLFYDNGMVQLQNGNLLFGNGSTGAVYEIDMLGRIQNSWGLQGNGFHHHVIEKPDGNLLVTINDASKPTIEDVVIEIDRQTGEFTTVWDLNESLDNTRRAWPTTRADLNIDWFHANAIDYDVVNDEIIVSGRTQGLVKLNRNNEVSYILAPHREWNSSGEGVELAQFLLTPIDANNLPIIDPQVLDGSVNHPDFEWSWYQHSPIFLPNGNLMVFDNGDNRNYINAGPYSRAVEYEIDATNMTIKQVWSYGKQRGQETFSEIVSKVSFLSESNSVLFTPGASVSEGAANGKVVEVDYDTQQVIFEASIIPPRSFANISFHNVLRIDSIY